MRKTKSEIEAAAVWSLLEALDAVGVAAAPGSGWIDIAGQRVRVEAKPVLSAALAHDLAGRLDGRWPTIAVADRISTEAREILRNAGVGFLDRRGHLRLVVPPIVIDTAVPATVGAVAPARGALSRPVAIEVAITCLLEPRRPHGVREVATYIERAPSAVSAAMAGLREEGLLTTEGEPLVPDLFSEVSAVWVRRFVAMAAVPTLADVGAEAGGPGWALSDTLGALAWGMPVVASLDHPPEFYVPSEAALQRAAALLGQAPDFAGRSSAVAIAPVRLACRHRADRSGGTGIRWPVANHIVVALDLAQDRARGAEILDAWHPEGIDRAW